jgi:hypothetical protein
MTIRGRCRRLAGLVLMAALATTGCNMLALPFFLIPGMEPKIDPKCKLASEDKEKEVKVVLLASTALETRPEFLRVDRDLSRMVVTNLQETFKKNKEKVTVVPISQIEKYKDDHPNWHALDPEEIGQHFKADYVINLEIDAITLYEPGSSNTLFRGRTEISLAVVNVKDPKEGPIYKEEYTCEYPRAKGPVPAGDSNPAQFRQRFLGVVAREISWRFTAHLVDDDLQCD